MARFAPQATRFPAVATATWTKINQMHCYSRKSLRLQNQDAAVTWRFELRAPGDAVPTEATDGFTLAPGAVYVETYDNLSDADVYAYQASGGNKATLAIQEGR